MKNWKKWIAVLALAIVFTVNFESIQANAATAKSNPVVIVDEHVATTASVKLQSASADYVLSEYAVAEPEAESIEWRPFYGALGVAIVIGAGMICVIVARGRKRDQKVIGKRGL